MVRRSLRHNARQYSEKLNVALELVLASTGLSFHLLNTAATLVVDDPEKYALAAALKMLRVGVGQQARSTALDKRTEEASDNPDRPTTDNAKTSTDQEFLPPRIYQPTWRCREMRTH